jgi:hypothetical protein
MDRRGKNASLVSAVHTRHDRVYDEDSKLQHDDDVSRDIFVSAISQKTAEEVEDEFLTRAIKDDLNGSIRLFQGVNAEMIQHSQVPKEDGMRHGSLSARIDIC